MSITPGVVTSNINLIKAMIVEALDMSNEFLGRSGSSGGFIPPGTVRPPWVKGEVSSPAGDAPVIAGETIEAAGESPPGISVTKPYKPRDNIPEPPEADSYSTGFVMPEAGTINDDSVAENDFTGWNEPVYTEFMLTELKTKIQNGFDAVAYTIEVKNGLWTRLISRHMTALQDALDRRENRWTSRGYSFPVNTEEVITRFGYAYADYVRDDTIKTAEHKADNKQFSINASLKGEELVIQKAEDIAIRALEVAKKIVDLNIKAFEANIARYIDVKIQEFDNALYYYSKDLLMKIKKATADIAQFSYNTKLMAEKNRVAGLDYDADIEAYEADAYYNEIKAGVNQDYNALSIDELISNLELRRDEIQANQAAFLKKANIEVNFSDKMGNVYAEYLRSIMEAVTALLHVAYDYKEQLTIE